MSGCTSDRTTARHGGMPRAYRRLVTARDRAFARVTVPREPAPRRWVAAAPVRPTIDPDLWAQHVTYARRRDPSSLETLVDHYRGFAVRVAQRHFRRHEPLDDLVQVALEALVRALQRFDPSRRTPFLAFAKPTLEGTLRRHYRDSGWSIRVPRQVHELVTPMREATEWLCQDLGREPTAGELADFLGVPEDDLRTTQQAVEARSTTSVHAVATSDTGHWPDAALAMTDANLASTENRAALAQGLELLSDEDRSLVRKYYFEGCTQAEIAAELGCSQMQVSRLLSRVLDRLRHRLAAT